MVQELKLTIRKSIFRTNGNILHTFTEKLFTVASLSKDDALSKLHTSLSGLGESEVESRQKVFGLNQIKHDDSPSWFQQLLDAFVNPFIGVLVIIAGVSLILDVLLAKPGEKDYKTLIVICIMIVVSVTLRFVQEFKSSLAAEKLRSLVTTTATVIRNGKGKSELEFLEIVPGDLIVLSAGDMIPADSRVIQSKDLFVNQSVLTGESVPVEKSESAVVAPKNYSPFELSNICLMGTNVISGSAIAVAVNTGGNTYFGAISKNVTGKRTETSFDKGINKISWLLIRFMLVMVPLIFLINGLLKGNWFEALLFAIAVAVGLTPEMLPMIVTANLAKGAVNMSAHKVIIKRLNAIQNIGAMDILCTDKTGTLTLDKVVLEKHVNIMGVDDPEVLTWAYLNSFHQTGVKSLIDRAILQDAEEFENGRKNQTDLEKIDEIPFDFHRRRLSVILKKKDNTHLLICKGAVEELLSISSSAFDPGEDQQLEIFKDEIIPLNDATKELILRKTREMNADGMRVLLLAVREFKNHEINYSVSDESDLVIAGLIGFLDPAKPSASQAIERLHDLGVSVKVLTGDNEIVTRKICKDVNIPVDHLLFGNEIETMTDAVLAEKIESVNIFCKLNPLQKSRVVKLLQDKGHTVGFLGDGINDAGALKQADVGISVDTATDIAKESADIILLENDLNVLRKGVVYGRRTFGNILKYIKMTTSSNFGNMFSMLGASAIFPFLPMLPTQLLLQNLLYDISQISIPWDRVDEEYINKPQQWDPSFLTKFIIFIGPISSLFDYATFAVMFYFFKANTPAQQHLFQTGWFVEGLLSQTLIVHLIRTRKIPFIQSSATTPVIALTVFIMLLGVVIPYTAVGPIIGMYPLPLQYFPFLIIILITYAILTQFVKTWFIRRFHNF